MKIVNMYELQTQGNVATPIEIATLTVNLNRGCKLREIKITDGKIHFLLEGDMVLSDEGSGE